jgi:flagellum-specific peptidoglycan hydrolase FlgJ
VHPIYGTIALPTKEYINHEWVTENAEWIVFPDFAASFVARMATLRRLAPSYPHYAAALAATTPEQYVTEVSLSWSTDPARAAACISILHVHQDIICGA